MKPIYVVVGMMGTYSERAEWLLKAFANKATADVFAAQAGVEAAGLYAEQQKRWKLKDFDWQPKSKTDPHIDEYGIAHEVTYFVSQIQLEE